MIPKRDGTHFELHDEQSRGGAITFWGRVVPCLVLLLGPLQASLHDTKTLPVAYVV